MRLLAENIPLKLVSLGLAALLWFVIAGEKTSEMGVPAHLELQNFPKDLEVTGEPVDTVEVRLRASPGIIQRIGPGELVVDQVDGLVGAHGQGLANGLAGLVRAHGQDGHLAAVRFGELEPLLDRVLVELVDDPVGGRAVEPGVLRPQGAFRPGIGDLLHADDDVHDRRPTSSANMLPGTGLRGGSAT